MPLLLSLIGVVTIEFGGVVGLRNGLHKRMAVEAVEKLAKKKKDKEQPRLRRCPLVQ